MLIAEKYMEIKSCAYPNQKALLSAELCLLNTFAKEDKRSEFKKHALIQSLSEGTVAQCKKLDIFFEKLKALFLVS